jgi:hypothetical protein
VLDRHLQRCLGQGLRPTLGEGQPVRPPDAHGTEGQDPSDRGPGPINIYAVSRYIIYDLEPQQLDHIFQFPISNLKREGIEAYFLFLFLCMLV